MTLSSHGFTKVQMQGQKEAVCAETCHPDLLSVAAVLGRPGGRITVMSQSLSMHDSIMTSPVRDETVHVCDMVCYQKRLSVSLQSLLLLLVEHLIMNSGGFAQNPITFKLIHMAFRFPLHYICNNTVFIFLFALDILHCLVVLLHCIVCQILIIQNIIISGYWKTPHEQMVHDELHTFPHIDLNVGFYLKRFTSADAYIHVCITCCCKNKLKYGYIL